MTIPLVIFFCAVSAQLGHRSSPELCLELCSQFDSSPACIRQVEDDDQDNDGKESPVLLLNVVKPEDADDQISVGKLGADVDMFNKFNKTATNVTLH